VHGALFFYNFPVPFLWAGNSTRFEYCKWIIIGTCHKFPCGGPVLKKPDAKKKEKEKERRGKWVVQPPQEAPDKNFIKKKERWWRGRVLGLVPVLSCRLLGGSMIPVFDHPLFLTTH
jgi:hypothetical protein